MQTEKDKINIYVSSALKQQLNNDATLFEVMKDRHIPNMNLFLTKLIIGYYEEYTSDKRNKLNSIIEVLNAAKIPQKDNNELAHSILNAALSQKSIKKKGEKSVPISLKPTEASVFVLQTIKSELSASDSISEYIRNMILNYIQKPMYVREQIVFKENYEKIQSACENHHIIEFQYSWNKKEPHRVIPYSIAVGSEGMFNYLICVEKYKSYPLQVRSYRLNRIAKVISKEKASPITDDVIRLCKKTKNTSPQYAINQDDEICVRLTDYGEVLYSRIYYGRPKYKRIENREDGHYYFFECSSEQVFHYFRRFENGTAIIISPEPLKHAMISFHLENLLSYKMRGDFK